MGRCCFICRIICVLLILWTEKIQCPIVNTQPESNLCVLRTPKGVDIQVSLKPSLNAKDNLHQNLDLSNAGCCFNPDKKCALTEHLNVTFNNITSLLKYPIQPLWMVVNNKRIPRFGVWDELWYSFYEFGEPSLTQTVDVQIIRETSFNSKEAFSVHLKSEKTVPPTTQTQRGPRDYLVLNQSLFNFPNSDCFNEKTRFLSLVHRQHRPCVEASSVDLEKQPYDFYVKAKVKEIRNEPTEFFLSSFGILHDTATTSRHRSSVSFISQEPFILHIFIPNEEPSSRSAAGRFLSTPFVTKSPYSRHLESFFEDQSTLGTAFIYDGCDAIARYFQLLTTFLKGQWSSAVGVLYSGADQLCDLLGSFDKFDRILSEKSIDYQWNLIWSYIDHACLEIRALRADEDMAAGWITFFVFSGFPVLLVTWLVASLRNPPRVEDIIMLNNDNGLLAFGRDDLVADFMQDAFNLPPLADEDDTNVDGTNTALVRQDTNRRSSSLISLTPSDIRLAMSIAYQDAARMFLQPSVSDPGINFDVETARFNSFRGAHPVIRCMSECEVMYLGQRSVETPCDLLTNTTNLEYYRPPPRRFFSDPCINSFNAIDQYHYIDDDDIIVRIGSSYDLMSVAHRETKNRVEGPPTGKLATVLKHSREVPSEREGTDLDEAYEIYMAQTGGALEVSEGEYKLDEGLRQALKNLIADVDKEYGNNTTPVKEESSERDEGTDLDEAYKIQMAQNGGAQDAQLPEEEYKLDEGVRQALKNLIADVDKEYGNNTTPAKDKPSGRDEGTDLEKTYNIQRTQNGGAFEVADEDYELSGGVRQALKNLITDVDKEYGNNTTPVKEEPSGRDEGTDLDEAYKIQMAQNGGALDARLPEEEYKLDEGVRQALKNLIADVDKEDVNNTTPVKEEPSGRDEVTNLEEAFKIDMAKNGGGVGVAQEDKDFQQALKDILTDTDEMFDINRTPRRRVTNFLWQCQEVMFYVLRIYMDNRFY